MPAYNPSGHRYACGQHVTFTDRRFLGRTWSGSFVIVKLLPFDGTPPRYELKSTSEIYTRVAEEPQLSAEAAAQS